MNKLVMAAMLAVGFVGISVPASAQYQSFNPCGTTVICNGSVGHSVPGIGAPAPARRIVGYRMVRQPVYQQRIVVRRPAQPDCCITPQPTATITPVPVVVRVEPTVTVAPARVIYQPAPVVRVPDDCPPGQRPVLGQYSPRPTQGGGEHAGWGPKSPTNVACAGKTRGQPFACAESRTGLCICP